MKTQDNKTAKTAKTQTQARTYETLTREEQNAMALEIASQVHTCKQAGERHAQLADRFGPAVAKEILAMAKSHVKARVQAVTGDAKSVSARLRNGEAVARDAWNGLLADKDVQGRKWARIVYESAGCDLLAMSVRFADYVAEMPDGTLAVAKRTTRKDANGEPVSSPIWKDGTKGPHCTEKHFMCPGNCSECAIVGCGCWNAKKGETILFEAH